MRTYTQRGSTNAPKLDLTRFNCSGAIAALVQELSEIPACAELVIRHLNSCRVKQRASVSKGMCVCAGVWPMWCSDALLSLSLALFLNCLSPGVLKLPDGKFFLGNSYTSYFSFLSHFFFFFYFWLCAANLRRYLDEWKNTDVMVSYHSFFFK